MGAGLSKTQATSVTAETAVRVLMQDEGKALIKEAERQVQEMRQLVDRLKQEYRALAQKIESVSRTLDGIVSAQEEYGRVDDEKAKNVVALYEQSYLHYVRDRNILNKTELIRLQRQFEDCMEQIQTMQRRADSIPQATALAAGPVGAAFIAGSVFAVTASTPIIWLTVLLTIPGFALRGAAYPICHKAQQRQRDRLLPIIDAKYEEAAQTAEKVVITKK